MTERDDWKFIRRMALANHIRATLADTMPNPTEQADWLRLIADSILLQAERAKRPLERFDVAADDPQGAF
jgi:hypothetical protein